MRSCERRTATLCVREKDTVRERAGNERKRERGKERERESEKKNNGEKYGSWRAADIEDSVVVGEEGSPR